jgi:hypothetical protein
MSGTPYGLLGTPMMGQQPGSGLGSLYNAVVPPSTWGTPAPAAPAPAPLPTYNQWGQMQGAQASVPSLNTGPGLPQQTGGGLAGLYDQWGRPTPQAVALAAAASQQAPQQQSFDASGIDPRTMAALSASAPGLAALAALSGLPNPYAGVPQGGGRQGLLGNAVAREGSGGGYGGNVTGGSTGALGAGGPPGGSGNAAVDAAAAASASAAAEQEQALGGMY